MSIAELGRRPFGSQRGLPWKPLLLLLLAPALTRCAKPGTAPAGIARPPSEQRSDPGGSKDIPRYSRLPQGLPEDLLREVQSEAFSTRLATIQSELLASGSRTANDRPLLITLLMDDGVLTTPKREGGGQCLPVFSTPLDTADFTQTLLPSSAPRPQYLVSTPTQFIQMLRDLEATGIDSFTIDPCPRCPIVTCLGSASIQRAEDVVKAWTIGAATDLAMAELYYAYSLEAARAGRLEAARDVALDAVSYLTLEDPRFHFLLGQTAIALRDPVLLAEARAFLRFLELPAWERKLEKAAQSGTPEFTAPEEPAPVPSTAAHAGSGAPSA